MDQKPRRHQTHHARYAFHMPGKRLRYTLIIIAIAVTGLLLLQASRAASYVLNSEAESGTVSGSAAKASIANASGGQAVTFGASPQPPATVRAITGGNSIAVVWSASLSPGIQSYEVYRNNSRIATVTPGSGVVTTQKQGRRYIDLTVERGQTYNYQVRAINAAGASSLTTAVSARHPVSTTPQPSITFEYIRAAAPANRAEVEATFRAELEIWYPKLSDFLAFPTYTPPTSLIVETNPDIGLMGALGTRIGYNPSQMNSNSLPDLGGGALVHEATHLINAYGGNTKPNWLTEGMADWTRNYLLLDRPGLTPMPGYTAEVLARGYNFGASFIQYITATHRASFPRDINITVRSNGYTSNYLPSLTGKTESQLIDDYRFSHAGPTGPITGVNGACIDVNQSSIVNGAKLQLWSCNGTNAQKWAVVYPDSTDKNPDIGSLVYITNYSLGVSKCIDVESSGTANGTKVHYWECDQGNAQRWVVGPDNSLINPNSNRCLSTTNGGSESGNQLIIADCDGRATQRWTLPR